MKERLDVSRPPHHFLEESDWREGKRYHEENGARDAIFLGDEKNGEMGPEARHGYI
jgi:hypothetical protein